MNLRKSFKKILVTLISIFAMTSIWAGGNQQGKSVVVVLDVSTSIRPYMEDIKGVINEAVIDRRLSSGDYFYMVTFGHDVKDVYAGKLMREADKESIHNNLNGIPVDGQATDIGQALAKTLTKLGDLKKEDFDLYEPMVLFITDGNNLTLDGSPYSGKTVPQIFKDDPNLIGNKTLYDGWYFVGVGDKLTDLQYIADYTGRKLLTITDLDSLKDELDRFISNIPPAKVIEKGSVEIKALEISHGGKILNPSKKIIPSEADGLSFEFKSMYERTPVSFEISKGEAVFQTDDRTSTVPFDLILEAGKISLEPSESKESFAGLSAKKIPEGKGTLKIMCTLDFGNGDIRECMAQTDLEFKPQSKIIMEKLIPIFIVLIAVILLVILIVVLKSRAPVFVEMTVLPKGTKSSRVKFSIGRKVELGSKPGAGFPLPKTLGTFAPVVGVLRRSGKKTWEFSVRDPSCFKNGDAVSGTYKMGSPIALKSAEGNGINVSFKIKK